MATSDTREGERPDSAESWQIRERWPFPSATEIERRFEDLIRRRWRAVTASAPADVYVAEDEVWVELDLPGVRRHQIAVRMERGVLLVEATRDIAPPGGGARPAQLERRAGRIQRRVTLPSPIGSGRIDLELEAGVLRVRVRRKEEP